jgi:hypothetical protein
MDPGHPESPERLIAIYKMLEEKEMKDRFVAVKPRAATREELERVHSPAYIDLVASTAGKRYYRLDMDTSTCARSYEAALWAAGGLLELIKAVMEGKQVAVLVPTTVLAMQHHQTFSARFVNFPVRVEMLCRFRPSAELKRVVRGLGDGTVDVVIGTHRLFQKDITFKNLGLLVVDEEHRFGVTHKERIKQMRPAGRCAHAHRHADPPHPADVALGHPRPERDRDSTDRPPGDPHLRDAARREPHPRSDPARNGRGGQVFFVHHRVQNIHAMAHHLKRLVPEARKLPEIGYEEMLELATYGSKAMQPRAIELAELLGVPIKVASSFVDSPGTLIHGGESMEVRNKARSIAHDLDVAKITVVGVPDAPVLRRPSLSH